MNNFGVSFSIKQCRNFGISSTECLEWLMDDAEFKRFRLMSYWNELEPTSGTYDFTELDNQIEIVSKRGGTITLCLGARQPRWPENHWPDWAWNLPKADRTQALFTFITKVVERYKGNPSIVSYQLENEALLAGFGERPEVDRKRLRDEFKLIKSLDATRPIAMSTSTSWGIPFRRPIGDLVGFSYYQVLYNAKKNAYTTAFHKPWLDKFKALLIKILWRRHSFIHELQLEPWGPKNIWEMPYEEQVKSMSPQQITTNVNLAKKTGLTPIDLWGGEWWYWCSKQGETEVIEAVLNVVNE